MVPSRERGRQMENATTSETTKDWRPAWRAFAEQTRPKLEGSHGEVAQASQVNLEESRDGTFRGFGSPQGKF